ncbi:uncharacterized protein LOC131224234 [Magnolia sinica]|uniref:uncharacterized protein LOC131224234 n=1 Tax=Magnolia sinica TaxID=86752 RepID=UPI002659918B|nr:uncharacterized protein LOC131224234 [Magnolia sinica]
MDERTKRQSTASKFTGVCFAPINQWHRGTEKSNETPSSPLFISPITSIYSYPTPTTTSSKSGEAMVHMAGTNQENTPTTEDRANEMADAQRALMEEYRNLREALTTLAHNIARMATPLVTDNVNEREQHPEGSQLSRTGSHGSVPMTRMVTQEEVRQVVEEAVRLEKEREGTGRFRYRTPYPREVEDIPFLNNFKHPDFQKFNEDGSPEEHLMHFITSMGNFSTVPQYCLRLFGSSLTNKAFRWYASLTPGSIRTWEQMQDAFMSNFFSSERDVSITELASV